MKGFPQIDTIQFSSGESLISGNSPDWKGITNNIESLEKFGLFDYATANYVSYNPTGTAQTKDEDFIYPVFRTLSEILIKRPNDWIDFRKPGVLKNSMPLLLGQAIYANHEDFVGNEIGAVVNPYWQDAYSFSKEGKTYNIPAGINAQFKIDAKTHTNLARKLTMNPPAIHSNSVTVVFAWEKSHPKMSDSEFMDKMGQVQKDGQAVRRIVSHILRYNSTSLVAHGQDQFAQILDKQGRIVLPEYADSREFTEKPEYQGKTFIRAASISYKTSLSLFEDNPTTLTPSKENNPETMFEVKEIATALGLEESKVNQAELLAFITKAKEASAELSTLKGELETVKASVTDLTKKLQETEPDATVGKTALTAMRNEALRLYKLSTDKPSESITELISKSGYDASLAFAKQYLAQVDEKLQCTCGDCGSHNLSRASSIIGEANLGIGVDPIKVNGKKPEAGIPKQKLNLSFIGMADNTTAAK